MPPKDNDVSPYLLRPLRSLKQAMLDRNAALSLRPARPVEDERLRPASQPLAHGLAA